MHRPIGVTILAVLAGAAGIFEVWRALVFAGIVNFTFVGNTVSFSQVQWGPLLWAVLLAAIWFWVAAGFWNLRGYAWSFGVFVSIFTVIFGFFALLGGSTMEAESVGWLLAIAIFFYLNYPGVRDAFVQHEVALMTPAQREAMEQMQAAQLKMAQATAAAAATPAATTPAAASTPKPPAPPAGSGTASTPRPVPAGRIDAVGSSHRLAPLDAARRSGWRPRWQPRRVAIPHSPHGYVVIGLRLRRTQDHQDEDRQDGHVLEPADQDDPRLVQQAAHARPVTG